jgi:hypothetical protein
MDIAVVAFAIWAASLKFWHLPDRRNNQIDHSLASLPFPSIKIDKEACFFTPHPHSLGQLQDRLSIAGPFLFMSFEPSTC